LILATREPAQQQAVAFTPSKPEDSLRKPRAGGLTTPEQVSSYCCIWSAEKKRENEGIKKDQDAYRESMQPSCFHPFLGLGFSLKEWVEKASHGDTHTLIPAT
jgi:hypothetical protein